MLDYMADVASRLCKENGYGVEAHRDIKAYFEYYLSLPNCFLICEKGRGGILGIVQQYAFNNDSKFAYDIGFWVEPELRGTSLALRLLKQFEAKAKELGADRVIMVGLETQRPEAMKSFYHKLGYRTLETNYIKEI